MSTGTWLGDDGSEGVAINSGRYVQYNLNGNIFEVSRKYVPLRPVGRGASGIKCKVRYQERRTGTTYLEDLRLSEGAETKFWFSVALYEIYVRYDSSKWQE
ncbi:hypothetical protein F2Q68_00000004 [Brassica cretica]|uniref:Uncharacterized protein n=1 Tax=Brassica cretica TaxID=69181 RepID=A0A8S9J6D4_BRACR|nr:hypothetical protein F2Q68_00000004 [Brassica cretica]